jgi:NitT/TauT family transport system substrate-binding protein
MMRFIVMFALAALLPATAVAQTVMTPMRIAVLGSADGSAEPLFAQGAGIFKKYGIDATVTSYNGGGAVIAAVAGGSLEAGFSNITSAVQAIENGIPVIVIAPADMAIEDRENTKLVKLRGNTQLRGAADLNGKIIGTTTLGGTLQLGAETWIDKNGGDSHSTHFVELPESSMVAALKQGRIAAAMLGEPLLTPAKADIEVLGNAFAAVAPSWISSVFVISKSWAAANPDATRRFVAAMCETARFANTHHADTAKIFAPVAGIDPALFATMVRATYGEQLTRALLQPGIDTAVKYGALKQPFDTEQIVTDAAPYWR